jgi:alpha-L-rhamnosidase
MLHCTNLTTEYQRDPIGLDVPNPRFSWQLESNDNNTIQTAYHIVVETAGGVVWDSGKIEGSRSVHVEYAGAPLKASTSYSATVTAWDNHDGSASTSGSFEMGLLSHENFSADWITHTLDDGEEACPVFRRSFAVGRTVERARIYATALGVYELELNGERVGDEYFSPGWTNYGSRLQYQTYDITSLLANENVLDMTVAAGWYSGEFGFAGKKDIYGDRAAALLELHIEYADGTGEAILTDSEWRCATGEVRYSEIYHGETIDSRIRPTDWLSVEAYDHKKDILVAQEDEPVRIMETLPALELITTPEGDTVIDFGQNLTGFVQVAVDCDRGNEITIRHAEVLDKDGNFYTENLRSAKCTDRFVCSGQPETFRPHFTFHGFRYIAVDGLGAAPDISTFTACVLHTDMEQTGTFECSNPLVNQLQHNIEWGQRGNFLDVPTDCPQRDERLGWTGDAQVFCRTAAYNMNVALFFTKWLRDLSSEQTAEHGVPHVIPSILGGGDGAAAWGDAATIIPWTMYVCYGDERLLREQFSSMKLWVEYIRSKAGDTGLWQSGFQFGDWLALDKEEGSGPVGATDGYLVATAFYAYSTELVRRAAEVLGYEDDLKEYTRLHDSIIAAFRNEYVTDTGRLVSETQTACILALHFGLVEERHRPRIIETLRKNLEKHDNHLATGFVGTPYLCHVLSENGLHDVAGKLLLQTEYPSWLYAVGLGATTIWERWNGILPNGDFETAEMNSFNHYAYGAIGDWLYHKVVGIETVGAGYKMIRIAPMFVPGLTHAKGTLRTMYGDVVSSWRCEDHTITVDISIPANCTAQIHLPEKTEVVEIGSGVYHYEYPTETNLVLPDYTMDSTLEQILAAPGATELIEELSPGLTSSPMIGFMRSRPLQQIRTHAPDKFDHLFEQVLDRLNNPEA